MKKRRHVNYLNTSTSRMTSIGHSTPDITYRYYKWLPKESLSNNDKLDSNLEENTTICNHK